MKIYQVPVGKKVQIRVTSGDAKYECEGVVVASQDTDLYLQLIRHKGQVIDFTSDKVKILAFYVKNEKETLGWDSCKIKKMTYNGKVFHLISSKGQCIKVNRRSAPRLKTALNGVVRVKSHEQDIDVVIVDVSLGGLGFISRQNIFEQDYSLAMLRFEDGQLQTAMDVTMRIMRKEEMPDGTYRFGAKVLAQDGTWIDYVSRFRQNQSEPPDVP